MLKMKEKVEKILSKFDGDVAAAAEEIYQGSRAVATYVLIVGLEHMKARARSLRRREIRRDIGLQPVTSEDKANTSFGLPKKAKEKLLANTKKLFGSDGWMIGDIDIQNYTREALLQEAERERRLSRGHIVNAQIYETLAEPMKPGQTVSQYWTKEAIKKVEKKIKGGHEETTRP
jgi:hypothetical protein